MKLKEKVKKIFTKKKGESVPEYPKSILLEPTNACNLKCRMCSVWGEGVKKSREVGFIKREIWIKALDEIGSWPTNINLDIHGAGEPLMHPDFLNILDYAKSKGNINVGFLCNATLLNEENSRAVIDIGIDWIGFSVDSAKKEIFEYYRKGAVLADIEANIEKIIALKRDNKPGILFNMVRHSEEDIELFIERWKGKADTLQISIKRPVDREQNKKIILQKPCPMPYQQLVMGWNGYSVLCCEDCWGEYLIGKFPEESLFTIWHGKKMNRARILHSEGEQNKINLCRHCDSGIFHDYSVMEMGKTTVRIELPSIKHEYNYAEV
ncbi:MAG: radical SAM protein [Candidatus Mariimomonas ferrooxydans]